MSDKQPERFTHYNLVDEDGEPLKLLDRLVDVANYVNPKIGFECAAVMRPFWWNGPDPKIFTDITAQQLLSTEPSQAQRVIAKLAEAIANDRPLAHSIFATREDQFVALWFYQAIEDAHPAPDFPSFIEIFEIAAARKATAKNLSDKWKPRAGSSGRSFSPRLDAILLGLTYLHWESGGTLELPSNENIDKATPLSALALDWVKRMAETVDLTLQSPKAMSPYVVNVHKWLSTISDRALIERLRPIVREFD